MNDLYIEGIVREAGEIIRSNFNGNHSFETKSTEFDPVTEIDRHVEAFLIKRLCALLPGSSVMAEETAANTAPARLLWVVDPIDGTVNFIHRFPFVCVSVALLVEGVAELGAVYNPILDEFFCARRGKGAECNGEPLRASARMKLSSCMLATGFPYDFATCEQNNMRHFDHFHRLVQGIRRPGSAALDLCYVAAGIIDGFWELDLKPWDVAAGNLIVEEAGGIVTQMNGDPYALGAPSILAAGPNIHPLMRTEIDKLANECRQEM